MSVFSLPDLGEGLEEAEIVTWHVSAGEHVVEGQPLVAVETDKAVVEIPAPRTGTIESLMAPVGAHVRVGAPLVTFADSAAADTGAIVGDLAAPEPPATVPRAAASAATVATTAAPRSGAPPPAPAAAPRAMPRVRALARDLGVDLAAITPSGPDGTISEADVRAAAKTKAPGVIEGGALQGPRRAMARNMARAHAQVVPATVHDEADVDAWASPDADVTVRLIRAVVAGCRAAPVLNAWLDGDRLVLRRHARIDIGLATETDDGLFTPVVRDAAARDAADLRAAIDQLKSRVRQRRIGRDELTGATVTLSNFGTLAGRHAVLVVSPPQVAILGAGRIAAQAVVRDGAVVARRLLPLSLTFDHRAATGGDAARVLAAVVADLQRPD
ncbi:MAG: 2-oxo acid dehydrogenase subunit E2 [Alphaproteobacteria bacterium]|nr:2-oxo acid dehydrogenase subunit E2 [Alphaproteobacteria bacterium]